MREPRAQRRFARATQADQCDATHAVGVGAAEIPEQLRSHLCELVGGQALQELLDQGQVDLPAVGLLHQVGERDIERLGDFHQQQHRDVSLTGFELSEIALRNPGIPGKDPACHAAPRSRFAHAFAQHAQQPNAFVGGRGADRWLDCVEGFHALYCLH